MKFFGREYEKNLLQKTWNRKESTLTIVHGRRRIGKSRLIKESFQDCNFLNFEGLEDGNKQRQKNNFCLDIKKKCRIEINSKQEWKEILIQFSESLENKPTVILLDEFQWLVQNSSLVSDLKYVWDNYFSKNNNIHLIICGSISSFLVKKVVKSKALYGRIKLVINLKELSFSDIYQNFKNKRALEDLIFYYFAVGGIPEYWKIFNWEISAELNLNNLAFKNSTYFIDEFSRIFISHFGAKKNYEIVTKLLAEKSYTKKELEDKLKLESGGYISSLLEDLELASFIRSQSSITAKNNSKFIKYSLSDSFLRFYLKFIEPNLPKILQANIPLSLRDVCTDNVINNWQGLQFEQFCRNNHEIIAKILGFSAVQYKFGSYYKKNTAQVDLLFVRKDKVVTVCECKFSDFKIGTDIIPNMQNKIETLRDEYKKYSFEKILITNNEITKELELKSYFQKVITLLEIVNNPNGI